MLADGRRRGIDEQHARLDALLAIMAGLDDTCVLYRGGMAGLDIVQNDAAAALAAGGSSTPRGHARLVELDRSCRQRPAVARQCRRHAGGRALPRPTQLLRPKAPMQTLTLEFPAANPTGHRAHVGVVGSGDLEILLEPMTA